MSDLGPKLADLTVALQGYITGLIGKLTSSRLTTPDVEAIEAETLSGQTEQEIIDDLQELYADHINDVTTNPHNITAGTIDALTRSEFDILASEYFAIEASIFSRYGKLDNSTITLTSGGPGTWTFSFDDEIPILMNGVLGLMSDEESYNLTDVLADPSNNTFNIYVEHTGGVFQYVIEENHPLNALDSETRMFVGTLTTTADDLDVVSINSVLRIGKYRLSNTPAPFAIPVSAGLPMVANPLSWV